MIGQCPCHTCHAKEFGIFSSLDNEELKKIKDLPHPNFYKKRQIIFHEDNPCEGFYVLKSGKAKLVKSSRTGRQHIVKLVKPGGIIGEDGVFEKSPYAFTAEAIEDSEACFINKGGLFNFLKERPAVALKIMSMLSWELRTARSQIVEMALKDARARMAGLILGLACENRRHNEKSCPVELYLTRAEMAEMIGVSQETAIRLICDFRDTGFIKTCHRQITILDEDGLMMAANGEPSAQDKTV